MNANWLRGLVLAWVAVLAACSSTPGGSNLKDGRPVALQVSPGDASLAVGTTLQLQATLVTSDGLQKDITTSATWTTTNPNVVTVSQGRAVAVHVGTAVVTVGTGGVNGKVAFTVTSAALEGLAISAPANAFAAGTREQLTVQGSFSDGSTQDLTDQVSWTSSDATVATVSGGQVSGVAPGLVTITATSADVSTRVPLAVTSAALQAIEVAPATPTVHLGNHQAFTAIGHFSDGTTQELTRQVSWTSSAAAVASVDAEGVSRGLTTGATEIRATLGKVTGSSQLTVDAAALVSIQIDPLAPSIATGLAQAFTATGVFSDGTTQDLTTTVTWSSSDETVATVSNAAGTQGLAQTLKAGQVTITATLGGASGGATISVTDATLVGLALDPSATIAKGTRLQLIATGQFSDGSSRDLTSSMSFTSADPATVGVSNVAGSRGLVSGLLVGGPISVTASDGAGHTATANVTVSDASLVSISVTPSSATVVGTNSQQYTATGTFTDGSTQDLTARASWTSTNVAVATISNTAGSNGRAQGVAPGSTTISASFNGVVSNDASLTVSAKALVSIAIRPAALSLVGGSKQLTATGTYNDGSTTDLTESVDWLSLDPSLYTVSNTAGSKGLVTFVAQGSTTIYAVLGSISGSATVRYAPSVLLLYADSDSNATPVQSGLIGTGRFSKVDLFDARSQTPTVAQLEAYDVVLTWGNLAYSDPVTAGDNLATYFEAGGQVVDATHWGVSSYDLGGRFAATYDLISNGANYSPGTLGTVYEPASPLMANVATLSAPTSYAGGGLTHGGVMVAAWSTGAPLIVRGTFNGRNRVDLWLFPTPSFWTGDGNQILTNALLYR